MRAGNLSEITGIILAGFEVIASPQILFHTGGSSYGRWVPFFAWTRGEFERSFDGSSLFSG
jgi:hypothetical protein